MRVKFMFNKQEDLKNNWETCNEKSEWMDFSKKMPPYLLKICKGKSFDKSKKDIERFWKNIYNSGLLDIFANAMGKAWATIEQEYLKRLKKMTGKPLKTNHLKAYITTASRCPYYYDMKDKNHWFMVNFFSNINSVLHIAGHEIMHIHFFEHYWKDVCKQLGKDKAHDLREALTVLLNLEFKDLWFVDDRGYEPHQELREFIIKQWLNKKDFDLLLDKCMKKLKEEGNLK